MASLGLRMEVPMSSEDPKVGTSCCVARSDAHFNTLYTWRGRPASRPSKSSPDKTGATVGPPVQEQLLTRADRDSLSFYDFPLINHHASLLPEPHSLIMETLVVSNRRDGPSATFMECDAECWLGRIHLSTF
ncbi:hypothetical protein MRX96_013321 [Rhipicephalus microplus]